MCEAFVVKISYYFDVYVKKLVYLAKTNNMKKYLSELCNKIDFQKRFNLKSILENNLSLNNTAYSLLYKNDLAMSLN